MRYGPAAPGAGRPHGGPTFQVRIALPRFPAAVTLPERARSVRPRVPSLEDGPYYFNAQFTRMRILALALALWCQSTVTHLRICSPFLQYYFTGAGSRT